MPRGLALTDMFADAAIREIALADQPAWVWDGKSGCVRFANAAGTALFGETDLAALRVRDFAEDDPVARQIARVAATLPKDGGTRMAMIRLATGTQHVPTACRCRRIASELGDLVLVVAVGAKGDRRALPERLAVLFDGESVPVSAEIDGEQIYANGPARAAGEAAEGASRFDVPGPSGVVRIAIDQGSAEETAPAAATPVVAPLHEGFDPAEAPLATAEAAAPAAGEEPEPDGAAEDATADAPGSGESEAEARDEAVAEPEPEADADAEPSAAARTETPSGDGAEPDEGPAEDAVPESTAEPSDETADESPAEDHVAEGEQEDEAEEASATAEDAAAPETGEAAETAPPAEEETQQPPAAAAPPPAPARKRFTFSLDAEGRVTEVGPALREAAGESGAISGRLWSELSEEYGLDPTGEIAAWIAGREMWDDIEVDWPREAGGSLRIRLEALPRFGEGRQFVGFRGFGEILSVNSEAAVAAAPAVVAPGTPDEATGQEAGEAEPGETTSETAPQEPSNVLRLHPGQDAAPGAEPRLSDNERSAFQAIAQALGARLPHEVEGASGEPRETEAEDASGDGTAPGTESDEAAPIFGRRSQVPAAGAGRPPLRPDAPERVTLEVLARLPWGVGVVRDEQLIYANRAFLQTFGYSDLDDLDVAGGLTTLFEGRSPRASRGTTVRARHRDGRTFEVEAWLARVDWPGGPAMLMSVREAVRAVPAQQEIERLKVIVELSSDGALVLDSDRHITELNGSACDLLEASAGHLTGQPFLSFVVDDERSMAEDFLDEVFRSFGPSVVNEGIEVKLRIDDRDVPVFMTAALLDGGRKPQVCVVLKDLRRWKDAEAEALAARRKAERENEKKSDFLAKMSHEVRTPLNAIIGFAEVMLEERFGALPNDRYHEYLVDIRESGEHIMSLVNDLLDLSKVEAGRLDLSFTGVRLNDVVDQSVAIMQPQANRQRVIVRTNLAVGLPTVVADSRSMRQVMMNLLSNAIKFTPAGGQVIVSTVITEEGDVALRVRDTGVGMTEEETKIALEPFRQVGARNESIAKGSGLGLPLTKALVEANRARFDIRSRPGEGTLIEITFPKSRLAAA